LRGGRSGETDTGLNRMQRIIMRSYESAFSHAKPPPEDYPLFLDRDTGADRGAGPLSRTCAAAAPEADDGVGAV